MEKIEKNFGWALEHLKSGRRVARRGWNGKGMYVELQRPDLNSKMTEPYIFMKTAQSGFVPWLASQTDMLATDWEIYAGIAVSGGMPNIPELLRAGADIILELQPNNSYVVIKSGGNVPSDFNNGSTFFDLNAVITAVDMLDSDVKVLIV